MTDFALKSVYFLCTRYPRAGTASNVLQTRKVQVSGTHAGSSSVKVKQVVDFQPAAVPELSVYNLMMLAPTFMISIELEFAILLSPTV